MHRSSIRLLGVVAVLLAGAASAEEPGAEPSLDARGAGKDSGIAPDAIFPIPGVERADPHFDDGKFGAFRPGRRSRRDCGRGHCGIDLIATVGTPVVAVKDGLVAQIDYSAGGEGGRWIRVAHDDGTCTWYMHLAHIRKGLEVGSPVTAGQQIATLGRTGVVSSPTHLHFALTTGRPGHEKHLNPTKFLSAAQLVGLPLDPEPAPPPKVRRSQRPEL
jgi:murein DD-endopeptidase MepM/ murein hydrolase activator NlpD